MAMKTGITTGAAIGVIAGLIGIYVLRSDESKVDRNQHAEEISEEVVEPIVPGSKITRDFAKGSLTAFVIKPERAVVPDMVFNNDKGEQLTIQNWRGKVVLLNLWATWCAPCREEMPALSALQKQMGSSDFEVVAVSVDRKGAEASSAFLIENGVTDLNLYVDKSAQILDDAQAIGLPTTLLIDRQGREIGRMAGPAKWTDPEALALIRAAIAEGKTS